MTDPLGRANRLQRPLILSNTLITRNASPTVHCVTHKKGGKRRIPLCILAPRIKHNIDRQTHPRGPNQPVRAQTIAPQHSIKKCRCAQGYPGRESLPPKKKKGHGTAGSTSAAFFQLFRVPQGLTHSIPRGTKQLSVSSRGFCLSVCLCYVEIFLSLAPHAFSLRDCRRCASWYHLVGRLART